MGTATWYDLINYVILLKHHFESLQTFLELIIKWFVKSFIKPKIPEQQAPSPALFRSIEPLVYRWSSQIIPPGILDFLGLNLKNHLCTVRLH